MRFFKGESPPYRGVAYRPDGRTLVTATQSGRVALWDLEAGRELTRLKPKSGLSGIDAIALAPDGRLLASAGFALDVWDVETGTLAAGFNSDTATRFRGGVAFVQNGERLVAGVGRMEGWTYRGYGLGMWNTADGSALPVLPANSGAGSLTTAPDGQSVFGQANGKIFRWHLSTVREYPTLTALQPPPCSLAASPAAGVVAQGVYRTVEIRDANGERLLAQWEAHQKGVFALAFSADGNLLATGSGDEVVKVWDVSSVVGVLADPNAAPLSAVPECGAYEWGLGPVRAIAFSPDGLTAAAVGDRVKFVVWDVE